MRKYLLPMMVLAAALCFSTGCDEQVVNLDGVSYQKGTLNMNPRVVDIPDIEPFRRRR